MYSYSLRQANVFSTLIAVVACVSMKNAFTQLWGWSVTVADFPGGVPALLIAVVAGLVVHEAIHVCVARCLTDRDEVRVSIGFRWRQLLPFVRVHGTVSVAQYRAIFAAPLVALGVVPAALGLMLGDGGLSLFGTIMIAGAAGDMLALCAIRTLSGSERVVDHPERVGCMLV